MLSQCQRFNVLLAAHDVGWIAASFFTIVACITSFWLIDKHLVWYNNVSIARVFLLIDYSLIIPRSTEEGATM